LGGKNELSRLIPNFGKKIGLNRLNSTFSKKIGLPVGWFKNKLSRLKPGGVETRWLGGQFLNHQWFIETTLVGWVLASSVCA